MNEKNPLLRDSNLRDNAICFSKIKHDQFIPAIKIAIGIAKENLTKIKNNSQAPNFLNTVEAIEVASEELEKVSAVFYFLYSAEATEDLQALAPEISSLLATFSSDLSLDVVLFDKVKTVYEQRKFLKLNQEENQLLEKYYKDFVRNGALLDELKKEELRQLDQQLSSLAPKYSENVLRASNKFELLIKDPKDLEGLPEGLCEAAHLAALRKDYKEGWLFNLDFPSFGPFLKYSSNGKLREQMWRAYNSLCLNDDFDNQELTKETVRIRNKRAILLGFKNHASFVLEDRMAQNPEKVMEFLESLLKAYRNPAIKDLEEVKKYKMNLSGDESFYPWDYAYYSEKLKESKFHFSGEELRPYFSLENVINGAFEHARKLFGIKFEKLNDVEVYHPDVKVYEVRDCITDEFIALFYGDFFPRETKKSGAWATTLRDQGIFRGEIKTSQAAIVCNFTKPTATKPALLTYDEVGTLFHEFGHALHMMLSKCKYRSLGGANVYWDFVELPSQIMENWIENKESLDLFARHFETNELIPEALVRKINNSSLFQVAFSSLRQLSFAYLDMMWHTTAPDQIEDIVDFENKALEKTRILPAVKGTSISTHFSHIFSGGYSAGYYSYKWAEVLDADAFEFFKEKGLFNPEIGAKFKDCILSKGGTVHPMTLYKNFRGHEPEIGALLRREGLEQ